MFERPSTTPLVPARKSQIDSAVEKYIIDSLRPLTTVEEPAFIELMKVINKMFDCLVADLKSELSYCRDVNFTDDIWSSLNTQSHSTITAHFVDKSWALCSKVLQTKMFPGSHTAVSISKSLEQVLVQDWGLNVDHLIGVSDDASNDRRAFDLLKYSRLSCIGHNINLSVKAGLGLSELDRLVSKGMSLVTYFHKIPLAMDILLKNRCFCYQKKLRVVSLSKM